MMQVAVLVLFLAPIGSAQPGPRTDFVEQVRLNFRAWDMDGDGRLSPTEIELAVANPNVKGRAAAAVAALRRAVRANREIGPLSMQQIADRIPYNPKATPKLLNLESLHAAHVE